MLTAEYNGYSFTMDIHLSYNRLIAFDESGDNVDFVVGLDWIGYYRVAICDLYPQVVPALWDESGVVTHEHCSSDSSVEERIA